MNPDQDPTEKEIKEILNEMLLTGQVIVEVRDGVPYYKINPEFNITPESASLN
jgi:hypothetical protein